MCSRSHYAASIAQSAAQPRFWCRAVLRRLPLSRSYTRNQKRASAAAAKLRQPKGPLVADQPLEVTVVSQTTPGRTRATDTTGAASVYDPPTPQALSAQAFAAQLGRVVEGSGSGVVAGAVPGVSGAAHSVSVTPGFPPCNLWTSGISYEIPLTGGTPR
jgi:hypothetical protein